MPAPVLLATWGVLVASLDSSLNIALPAMAASFGVGAATIRWVIICYVLTYALTAFGAGLIADRLGARRVFAAGLWISAVAFIAYLFSPSFGAVLVLRVIQGVGGGLVYGTAPALVTQALPRVRHGRGLGIMSLGLGAGMTVGPILGGLLLDGFGWSAVFVYRAPVTLAVAALTSARRGDAATGPVAGRMAVSLDVLRPAVLVAAALSFLANYAQFAIWLLIPFYLVSARGIAPAIGGFLFTVTPFTNALCAPAGGWAADRIGPAWPAAAGLIVEVAGLYTISRLGGDSHLASVVVGLALVGLGVGVFQVSNLAQMMTAFPRAQQGAAGGLAFLARTLGSAVGVQVTAALFDARLASSGFIAAFQWAFLGAAAAAGLAALIALGSARRASRAPVAL